MSDWASQTSDALGEKDYFTPLSIPFSEGDKAMAMDIVEEGQEVITTGSTPVGLKMNDTAPATREAKAAAKPVESKLPVVPAGDGGAVSSAAPMQWPSNPNEAQTMIDKLMASPKFRADYADANNPDRQQLVEGMTSLFKMANPEVKQEQQQAINPEDALPDLREAAGVKHHDLGGERFDPQDEVNFLHYSIEENIPPQTVRGMVEWYGTRAVTAGWQPLTREDIEEFRATFASRLKPEQMTKLVEWYEKEITPKLLARRQR